MGIFGYRSLRAIRFPVGGLTVFVGGNGVGKTNLYRGRQLLQASAAGTLAREIASEGIKRNGETWLEGLKLGGSFAQDEDDDD